MLDGLDACRAELARSASRRRRTPRCSPAPRPVAACGSRSSATRSWSPPRPAAGWRSPAAARWSPCSVVRPTTRPTATWRHTTRPDVVLLTGGTDGGDEDGILLGARRIAASGWHGPVVVAGNVDCAGGGRSLLLGDLPVVVTDNVVPRIGVLEPGARAAGDPRDVPGPRDRRQAPEPACGLHLDGARRDPRPGAHRCRGARGRGPSGDGVVVVDIGGATTDVHSVVQARSRGRRALPRGGGEHAGDPDGRG